MTVVIKVENVSKRYQLGKTGTRSLKGDVQRWWARKRGKDDPMAVVADISQVKDGEFWALKDINFEVRQGEALGIVGKNGAGKSTLLKLLSRITLPTTGSIKVKGRIASLLEVGTGFNPDLTGRENIYLNGGILGMTKAEITKKFDEIVDFSGIERFIDTPVKRYSSGMYVRLAFAVAAHLESEILILDEVLAVGDAEFQRKCLSKMNEVTKNQGRTILFVSHAMGSVADLCTRAVYLKKGSVYLNDEVNTVIRHYVQDNSGKKVITDLTNLDPKYRRGFGHARYTDIKIMNEAGEEQNEFIPGQKVMFRLSGQVYDQIQELYASIALRGGSSREIVTNIKKNRVDRSPLKVGDCFSCEVLLDTSSLRPNTYDLYFWLGSRANEEPYDVIDGLTPPLVIGFPQGYNPLAVGYFDINYTFKQIEQQYNPI